MSADTMDLLRRLARDRPADSETRVHLARMLHLDGEAAEALVWLEEVLALDADHLEALRASANLLAGAGRRREALTRLNRAQALGGPEAQSSLLMAKLLLDEGDRAAAENAYHQAVGLQPNLEDAHFLAEILGPSLDAGADAKPTPAGAEQRLRVATTDPRGALTFEPERASIDFGDVGGMEEVKEALRMNIILPIEKPDLFRSYGKKLGGGLLMYGPPGVGKSYLAKATAGECGASFFMVGLHEILDMYVGQSEKNLNALFAEVRRQAPSVLFLDEIDALGSKRGGHQSSALRGTVNQLLVELDRISQNDEPVLVVGATNTPWSLDTALKRPGRFDRILFVPPPDLKAREEILRLHLRKRPTEGTDLAKVARKTPRFSGADLKAVVERATEAALHQAMKTGRTQPITTKMLLEAASMVPSTGEWLSTARDYARYSDESGMYAPVTEYLAKKE